MSGGLFYFVGGGGWEWQGGVRVRGGGRVGEGWGGRGGVEPFRRTAAPLIDSLRQFRRRKESRSRGGGGGGGK